MWGIPDCASFFFTFYSLKCPFLSLSPPLCPSSFVPTSFPSSHNICSHTHLPSNCCSVQPLSHSTVLTAAQRCTNTEGLRFSQREENIPPNQYLHSNFPTGPSPLVLLGFHPFSCREGGGCRWQSGSPLSCSWGKMKTRSVEEGGLAPQAPTWEQRQADGLKGAIECLSSYLGIDAAASVLCGMRH